MKKVQIFDDLIEGFAEAIKYRRGQPSRVRVSRAEKLQMLRPEQIRRIRTRLRVSQPWFAEYIGTSVATVRSWEQGIRKPNSTALRLLTIAKERPAVLLQVAARHK